MIVRNLLRRKLRTLFALGGVALAVGLMVALSAVMEGFVTQRDRIITDFRGDVMVQLDGAFDPLLSVIDFNIIDALQQLPQVASATPVVHYLTSIKPPRPPGGSGSLFLAYALPAGSTVLLRHPLIEGRYFSEGRREVIVGAETKRQWNLEVGRTFSFSGAEFRVVGVYRTKLPILDNAAIYGIDDFRDLHRNAKFNVAALDLKRGGRDAAAVIQEIQRRFPRLEALESLQAFDRFREGALVRKCAWGVSLIALTIAALGILNTMVMSVYERTQEIGLLRALGWSSRMILAAVVGEGLLIAVCGGAAGAVLGVVLAELLVRLVDIGMVQVVYSAEIWPQAALVTLLVGAGGALVPGWRAMSITPAEALRHE